MTIAREGLREIMIATAVCGVPGALAVWAALNVSPWYWAATPLLGLWLFTFAFFRDPHRVVPIGRDLLVAPADGKVTEVSRVDRAEGIDGPAWRISIFLSVFDVHINRAPCAGRVVKTDYRRGEFLDARHPECGVRNEANTMVIDPAEGFTGPVIVKQIAGLIARRIICRVSAGDRLERGQKFGLIKFGSRTELVVPVDSGLEPAVKVNDYVFGGRSVVMQPGAAALPSHRRTAESSRAAAAA